MIFQGVPPFMDPYASFFGSAFNFLASPQKDRNVAYRGCSYHLGRHMLLQGTMKAPTADAEFRKIFPALGRCFGGDIQVMGQTGGQQNGRFFIVKKWETDDLPVESGVCRVPHFQSPHSSMGSKNDPNLGRLQVGLLR